jgi:hypothetical protein
MSRSPTALRRLGIAAVAAVTLGGLLPLAFTGAASANDNDPRLIVTGPGAPQPDQCETFTVTRHDADQAATPTATITITVSEDQPGSVTFCSTDGGTTTDNTTGDGDEATLQFTGAGESFTFGLLADEPLTASIIATATSGSGFAPGSLSATFAAPAATPTATVTASPSPTQDSGSGQPPPASASPSASPSASASASPSVSPSQTTSPPSSPTASPTDGNNRPPTPPGCLRAAEVMLARDVIIATGSSGVSVTATPNSFVELLAYTRPSTTFRVVRSGTTDANGNITFANLRPPANTRLVAQQRGCAFGRQKVLNVRTLLTLFVERNGTRTYTFSGRALPARPGGLIVSLYRVTGSGRQVLTSQTRADASTGRYVINRRFTGSGRFGFVVRTGQDLQNAPGSSNVRSLLVF